MESLPLLQEKLKRAGETTRVQKLQNQMHPGGNSLKLPI